MMIRIEELPPEDYKGHKFKTLARQLTTKESTKREMRQETENCQNKAIVGCNTNNSSLWEPMVQQFLVILYFRPPNWKRALKTREMMIEKG
jgi:hypothetical protein